MRFLKTSSRLNPEISVVLLDWEVRESFHLLHYLRHQTAARDRFEVIVIEYYSQASEALREHSDNVDTWVLFEMPREIYYHKHLMYNAGILLARGDIVVFMDSDAMVRESFIESLSTAFRKNRDVVVHIDQFRNSRRDLYPFRYPTFDEVIGDGCTNYLEGKTRGLYDRVDPLHTRNYGACMAARRADLIAIGGADEHRDYLGHICGPYEMTFRLVNSAKRALWLDDEFTYHTWHPGQAGDRNFLGPHDGRHVSTTALRALAVGRIMPLVENLAVRLVRTGGTIDDATLREYLVSERAVRDWRQAGGTSPPQSTYSGVVESYRGALIVQDRDRFTVEWKSQNDTRRTCGGQFCSSLAEAKRTIDVALGLRVRMTIAVIACLTWCFHSLTLVQEAVARRKLRLSTLFSRPSADRISRGVKEGASVRVDIGNVVAALLLWSEDRQAPDVLVAGREAVLIMKWCMRLRILPVTGVEEARESGIVRMIVKAASDKKKTLLVSSGAYVRFYESFTDCPPHVLVIA